MFTTESLEGNLLIQMRLTFTYKTHKFFHAYVLTIAFPIHVEDFLGFIKCEWEKKRENMKSEGTILEGK